MNPFSPIDPAVARGDIENFGVNLGELGEELIGRLNGSFMGGKSEDFYVGLFTAYGNVFIFFRGIGITGMRLKSMFSVAVFVAEKVVSGSMGVNPGRDQRIPEKHMIDRELTPEETTALSANIAHQTSDDFESLDGDFLGDKSSDFYRGLLAGYTFSAMSEIEHGVSEAGRSLLMVASLVAYKMLNKGKKFTAMTAN